MSSFRTWQDDYYDGVDSEVSSNKYITYYNNVGWDKCTEESIYRDFIEDTSDDEYIKLKNLNKDRR